VFACFIIGHDICKASPYFHSIYSPSLEKRKTLIHSTTHQKDPDQISHNRTPLKDLLVAGGICEFASKVAFWEY